MKPSGPTCICSDDTPCNDPDRTLTLELTSSGERITAAISYCEKIVFPERTCNDAEVALIVRWGGPFSVSVVGDVKCHCYKTLVIVEKDIGFATSNYACGTPTCNVSESAPQACERITISDNEYHEKSELPCRCPCGYSCDVDLSKIWPAETTDFFCKKTGYTSDST